MNCRPFVRFVDAKPLRERSPRDMQHARSHADRCRSCAAYLRAATQVEQMLTDPPHIVPSGGFSETVMARVHQVASAQQLPAPDPRAEIVHWAGVLIAGLALAAALLYRIQPVAWLKDLLSLTSLIRTDVLPDMTLQWPHDLLGLLPAAAAVVVGTVLLLLNDRSERPAQSPAR